MRLDNTARKFDSNATLESSAFRITASAKAFQVLSDQLYNDKPLAILRELGANAYDAHVANGNPEVPFDVHLPTRLNPELIIKDHGIGLSRDQVFSLYTTYFDSDKTHTNELIGGLGLGSKSPFSYTDQFTVTSRFNGEKVTYLAYIDDSGIPAITEMSAEPMDLDDTTGLTITLPIKDSDHSQFERAAVKALSYFATLPTINRDVELGVKYTSTEFDVNGLKIKLRDPDGEPTEYYLRNYLSQGMRIVMGGVHYPVEYGKFEKGRHRSLAQKRLDIYAPIGWADFTASREGLAYTKQTLAKLMDLFNAIDATLESTLQALVADATTLTTANQIRNDFCSVLGLNNLAVDWNGFKVSGTCHINREFGGKKIRHMEAPWNNGSSRKFKTRYLSSSDVEWSAKTRLYWRPSDTGTLDFFNQNPPERGAPCILFTGDEADVTAFFKDTGVMPQRVPEVAKPAGSKKKRLSCNAQYQARILLTLGQEAHDLNYALSRQDIAEALEETDTIVFLDDRDEAYQNILVRYDSRLKDKDIIFVSVPMAHSKIRETFIKMGARSRIGENTFENLLPQDRYQFHQDIRSFHIAKALENLAPLSNLVSTLQYRLGSYDFWDQNTQNILPEDLRELCEIHRDLASYASEWYAWFRAVPGNIYTEIADDARVTSLRNDLIAWITGKVENAKVKYFPIDFRGRYSGETNENRAVWSAFFKQCQPNEE